MKELKSEKIKGPQYSRNGFQRRRDNIILAVAMYSYDSCIPLAN